MNEIKPRTQKEFDKWVREKLYHDPTIALVVQLSGGNLSDEWLHTLIVILADQRDTFQGLYEEHLKRRRSPLHPASNLE